MYICVYIRISVCIYVSQWSTLDQNSKKLGKGNDVKRLSEILEVDLDQKMIKVKTFLYCVPIEVFRWSFSKIQVDDFEIRRRKQNFTYICEYIRIYVRI